MKIGTVPKAVHKPDFAFDPFVIISACPRSAGVEKLVFAAPDVNGDREFVFCRVFYQPATDLPGSVLAKAGKLKLLLFQE